MRRSCRSPWPARTPPSSRSPLHTTVWRPPCGSSSTENANLLGGQLARVLIVDDDPGVCLALRRLVVDHGHIGTVAGDATEARAELATGSFEVILCDVNLPGESGLELVHDVVGGRTDIAVLMVSAADDPQLAETALALGAYGYIVKPFRDSEVNIGIANALRRRRLEIENKAHHERLEQLVAERTAELDRSREETIH